MVEILYNNNVALSSFGGRHITNTCIILISGKPQSGKSSLANSIAFYLKELKFNVLRTSFAEEVKVKAKEFFNWDGEKDEQGRKLLQSVGMFGRWVSSTFWSDKIAEYIINHPFIYDFIVIDDFRFPSEKDSFTRYGIYNIVTVRRDSAFSEQTNHIAESSLDKYGGFDVIITDTDTEQDVKKADRIAKELIKELLKNLDKLEKSAIL